MAVDLKGFQKIPWYYQFLIVGGVSGGLLGLFWYQYLTPMNEDITAKEAQVTTLNQEIAKSNDQKKVFEQFKKEAEELQRKLDSLKSVLPQAKETDQILRQVQQAAGNSVLRILRVAPRAVVDREVYSEWPIEMDLTGTYHNVGLFLDKIRQLPRIVNISGMRLTARTEGATATVSATCIATTFVYKEEVK